MPQERVESVVNDSPKVSSKKSRTRITPEALLGAVQSKVKSRRFLSKSLRSTLSKVDKAMTGMDSFGVIASSNLGNSSESTLSPSECEPKKKLPFFEYFMITKGHLGSHKWTKNMSDSLVGIRHGMSVFDAEKTKIACTRVFKFLKTYRTHRGLTPKLDVLFVNTSEQYRHLIKMVARASNQRYINEKWVGGTLTNWSQISQSYSLYGRFHLLYDHFLKRRKIHLPLYEKARRIYSGLLPPGTSQKKTVLTFQDSDEQSLIGTPKGSPQADGLPDVIFLMNPEENQNVLHEANLLKIPVIALADSQTQISGIDYMIPGNIQSIEFVYWCLNFITIALQKRSTRSQKKGKPPMDLHTMGMGKANKPIQVV